MEQSSETPIEKRRRLANERKRRWLQRQSQESLNRIRELNRASQRVRIDQETDSEAELRRRANADCYRSRIQEETESEAQVRRQADAERHRRRIEEENEPEAQVRRQADAERHRRRIEEENEAEAQLRRQADAERHRRRIEEENEAEAQLRRQADAERHRRRIEEENESEAQVRRQDHAETQRLSRRNEINNVRLGEQESEVHLHYCGPMNSLCEFCASKNFAGERPPDGKFNNCCRKGKVCLTKPMDSQGNDLIYPRVLQDLLMNPENPDHKNFRKHIRSYNSALSFASMGAKVVNCSGRGPYVFKVHGQICHRASHLQPPDEEQRQFAQLYVVDSTQATENRIRHQANRECVPHVLDQLDRLMRSTNRLCDTYRMLRDVEAQAVQEANEAGQDTPIVNLVFRRDRHSDQRRFNAPAANEIAMVFVNDDGEPPFDRDIRIYPVNPADPEQQFVNINILSPNLDPMSYPILFPFGEPGWQPNWTCDPYPGARQNRIRNNITMLQYKAALMAIRDEFNPVISAGRLTQQFIVDSYLQVEANNLNFIRMHQQHLRTELYQGLADHIENRRNNIGVPGIPIILPSSFEGSPRNMRERCSDAMSIFAKFGPPDLFVTFTANPKWQENIENLRIGEEASDRPDLVARVFHLKLKSILKDLTAHGVLGVSTAHVYTIEFQKRGLPHAHILIVLRTEDKFSSVERIDRFVNAEIPDAVANPRLHEIVTRCMIHGPCGSSNPRAPCMENGKCSKNFPKDFQTETVLSTKGYPKYRRRMGPTFDVRGATVDNRFVVPYNAHLLLKYDAHINVEVCTSLKAVKYIYKYIYKGFDCANMVLSTGDVETNEISSFIDARYVSAPEAMWRLLQCKMHDRSHAVIRLPVHLPNQQRIVFRKGQEEEALHAARTGITKLEAWFQLNQTDPDAHTLLYTDIPYSYVYVRNTWQKRQRGGSKIVPRMYIVSVKEEERFYLRMLLLHVRGATSFEFLRTVDNTVYSTFKEAAFERHLMDSDEEWDRCLREAAVCEMPKQMRQTFVFIMVFCNPNNVRQLWDTYSSDMSVDFQRHNDESTSLNLALHEINSTLKQHRMTCASFGLPMPTGNPIQLQVYNRNEQKELAETQIASLNPEQLEAFQKIVQATENINETHRYFFIDGPGGSGKTYLYSTLLNFIRGKGQVALPFATTGIAATLLDGGRTVHSGFKLPVPILETSVSSLRSNTPEAVTLRDAELIIIDEISMLTKDGLRCIDCLLKEIMRNNSPFGGKVLVVGGDFGQTLPVVPRGSRTHIIETCIKSSPLWRSFTKLSLSRNMRSAGQEEHNNWLLTVGEGTLPTVPGSPPDSIEIPQEMVQENIIQAIFGEDFATMQIEDLAIRVILAPTNKTTLDINMQIISKLQGEPQTYYSVDSVVSEDPNDILNYPVEFLHELTPSGMPPHKLTLKTGSIVMLLRNLSPNEGLCNGTRLSVQELHDNFLTCKILSQSHRGETVFIPRVNLSPSDVTLPFTLKRRQFPLLPAYAMTINKSQGQTFEHVGILLDEPVFAHGQLYVALSRCRNQNNIKIHIPPTNNQGQIANSRNFFTTNVVFREVL